MEFDLEERSTGLRSPVPGDFELESVRGDILGYRLKEQKGADSENQG